MLYMYIFWGLWKSFSSTQHQTVLGFIYVVFKYIFNGLKSDGKKTNRIVETCRINGVWMTIEMSNNLPFHNLPKTVCRKMDINELQKDTKGKKEILEFS